MRSRPRRILSNYSHGENINPCRRDNVLLLWEFAQRLLALLLIFPALVIALIFGLAIRIGSPGSLLVRQTREGKEGASFSMFKLRTMVVDAENYLQHLKENAAANKEWNTYGRLVEDPRIAGRVAKFARRFSIDELPQILNVVYGDMNLVGPRPLPPDIAELIPHSDLQIRRKVLPGITGLWQVSGRSELKISEIGWYDRTYVENRNVFLDIGILFRTVIAVIGGKGAY